MAFSAFQPSSYQNSAYQIVASKINPVAQQAGRIRVRRIHNYDDNQQIDTNQRQIDRQARKSASIIAFRQRNQVAAAEIVRIEALQDAERAKIDQLEAERRKLALEISTAEALRLQKLAADDEAMTAILLSLL